MLTWRDDETFSIDDVEFLCRPIFGQFRSEPGRFCLLKRRADIELYERLIADLDPQRIVEIGTHDGGSAALVAALARPERLVTIDRRAEPSDALTHFIDTRELSSVVSAYCGVDQGDAARLGTILDESFGRAQLDLVVDDASHRVDLTRRTFNAVFPRVRPGGIYAIEDWSWAHTVLAEQTEVGGLPLTVLVFELVLACACTRDIVTDVSVSKNVTLVTRGDAPLEAGQFDISNCYGPKGRALVPNR